MDKDIPCTATRISQTTIRLWGNWSAPFKLKGKGNELDKKINPYAFVWIGADNGTLFASYRRILVRFI